MSYKSVKKKGGLLQNTGSVNPATAYFASMVDYIPEALIAIDHEWKVIGWNVAAERTYGWSAWEVMGKPLDDFLQTIHFVEETANSAATIAVNTGNWSGEISQLRKDGTRIPVWSTVSAVKDEEGGVIGFIGINHDISEQKRAGEKLRQSEERFRDTFDQMLEGVQIFDFEWRYLYLNPAAERHNHRPNSELLGNVYMDMWPGIETVPVFSPIKRCMEERIPSHIENEFEYPDGSVGWFELKIRPIPEGIFILSVDITERKKTEEALRLENERFLQFANSNIVGIVIAEANGKVPFANDYYLNLLGVTQQDFKEGKVDWRKFTPPEWVPADEKALRELQERGVCEPYEKEYIRADGSRVAVYIADAMLPGPGGQIAGFVIDITARKRTETALRKSEQQHHQISTLMSDYVYSGLTQVDGRTKTNWVSGAFERITGYSLDEVNRLSGGFSSLVLPEDLETVMSQQPSLFEQGTLYTEYRIRRKDGEIRWLCDHIQYLEGKGFGEPATLLGAVQDITERKQAEVALRRNEHVLRLFVEHSPAAIAMFDTDMKYIVTSRRYLQDYQLGDQDLTGRSHYEVFPEITERIKEIHRRCLAGAIEKADEDPFHRANGRLDWVQWEMHPWYEETGKVSGVILFSEVVTKRKQAENQLQVQLKRMRALNEIDRAISSSLDIRLSLEILLDKVLAQLEVDAASVLLLNPTSQTLEYETGRGFRSLVIRETRMRLGEGLAGQVGMARKVIHVPDIAAIGDTFLRQELLKKEGFIEYFGVPLVAKGMLKGVLEIFHRSPLDANVEWLDYLETLGGQAAIAIDNAQLFEGMQMSNLELVIAYDATIEGWSRAMDLRDKETEGHTLRVTETTVKLAKKMGISQQEITQMRRGALLHDIGKLGVPDHILHKPDKLTQIEWAIMRQHPTYAFNMLMPIHYLRSALDIPYCHHEKWDGTGYPRGLKGEGIPLAARIFAVVDVWDALRSDRPYRAGWASEKVRELIIEESGTHFDPRVVQAFLELLDEDPSLQ